MQYDWDEENGYDPFDNDEDVDEAEDGDEGEDYLPESSTKTDPGVEISMEIDEDGNEVWFASDSRIPGSTSMGHSVEEAVEGVEDRRQQYRDMLRKSREERRRREEEEDPD